jgi:hypothetical protein
MAIVANTYLSFSAVGNREDLVDTVYNVSPTDTPFQASIGKNKAEATYHEWQTDVLASAAANAQLQGDDTTSSYTFSSVVATKRLGNQTQISRKDTVVSGTQDAVSKAGRHKEVIYQLLKKNKELCRDIEFVLTQNQARNTNASSSVAPLLAGLENWYGVTQSTSTANVSRGATGANSNTNQTVAATDGTQRPLTEALLKGVIQGAWTNGGDIDLIMCGPFNKTVISTFTGNNTRTQDTSDKKLVSAIDVYVSDFGTHKVVANRFQRERTLHVLMSDMFAVSYLRPKQTIDLAKNGDNVKAMILAEYTLESRNDSGSGVVADLTTS